MVLHAGSQLLQPEPIQLSLDCISNAADKPDYFHSSDRECWFLQWSVMERNGFQMVLRTLVSCFMLGGLCIAQVQKLPSERLNEDTMQKYGLSGLKVPYQAMGQTGIRILRPLLESLRLNYGIEPIGRYEGDSITQFDGVARNTVQEDEHRETFNTCRIHITLVKSIEAAPEAAAAYINRVSVPMAKSSFSGVTIGDWTANLAQGRDASLLFIRKNARVAVHCETTVEFTKSDRALRDVPDSGLKQRCEDLARDIDAELLKLPVAAKELK